MKKTKAYLHVNKRPKLRKQEYQLKDGKITDFFYIETESDRITVLNGKIKTS